MIGASNLDSSSMDVNEFEGRVNYFRKISEELTISLIGSSYDILSKLVNRYSCSG